MDNYLRPDKELWKEGNYWGLFEKNFIANGFLWMISVVTFFAVTFHFLPK